MTTVGIIGAMDEEIEYIRAAIGDDVEVHNIAGMVVYRCTFNGSNIALVRCGIGKVNAAVCAQVLIDKFNVDMVINTGSAGALEKDLNIGDIVVSTDLVEHDMDTSALGDPVGQVPRMDVFSFRANEKLISLAVDAGREALPHVKTVKGRIVTGDQFINNRNTIEYLQKKFSASATEMEGAAIGHVCYLNNIPFVVIRSISDKADGSAHMDFSKFIYIASENSSNIVMHMVSRLN